VGHIFKDFPLNNKAGQRSHEKERDALHLEMQQKPIMVEEEVPEQTPEDAGKARE